MEFLNGSDELMGHRVHKFSNFLNAWRKLNLRGGGEGEREREGGRNEGKTGGKGKEGSTCDQSVC